MYSVSYFSLGGFGALFGVAKPNRAPRGDGTGVQARCQPETLWQT